MSSSLIRYGSFVLRRSVRAFSTPVAPRPDKPESSTAQSTKTHQGTHSPNSLEKRMLVWVGKYKTTDEVPSYVNQDVMEKARNRFRIRLANIMMAMTAIGCFIMVWSGKSAAERGETVQKMNLDWHAEYNEKSRAEAEAKVAQKTK